MRVLVATVVVALLGGCAAPASQQIDQLNLSSCCTSPGQLPASGALAAESAGDFSPQTPLVMMNGKRSPAVRFLVPPELAGRKLQVRASPMQAGFKSGGIAFAPVAAVFLAADGTPVAASHDTGLDAGPAPFSGYSYALWRTVTVPERAASAVFYSDPGLYGTEQTFAYRFGGTVPAGGALLAMSAPAKAFYKVYGGFSVKVL